MSSVRKFLVISSAVALFAAALFPAGRWAFAAAGLAAAAGLGVVLRKDRRRARMLRFDLDSMRGSVDLLRAEVEQLEEMNRLAPAGFYVYVHRADGTGGFRYISDGMASMLGWDKERVLADFDIAFANVHEEDLVELKRRHLESVQKIEPFRFEGRFLSDGEIKWVRIESRGSRTPDGGSRWVGVAMDRTDRHEAEEALRRSESRYKALFEKTPVPMWVFDRRDLRLLDVNQAAVERYGYSREEFLARTVADMRVDGQNPELLRRLESPEFTGSARHRTKDGRILDVEIAARDLGGPGAARLAVAVDVTERLRAEEALQAALREVEAASKAKSEFLAMLSHEIRTPLNAVQGMLQLALNEERDAKQRTRLEKARGAAKSLITVLNDILDYSKIEAGALELDATDFDPAQVVLEVADLFETVIVSKGVSFEMDCAPELPRMIEGDPLRLRQVLTNLLGNAAKFTERGSVRLEAFVESSDGEEARLRFSVRDTGIGLDPANLEKLFQPFTQADGGTTRNFGGTGLGLAICRALVDKMGGRIDVVAEAGKGAVFSFTVVCRVLEASATSQLDAGVEKPPLQEGGRSRILLVEDNPLNQEVGRGLLEFAGYEVGVAENGMKALEILAETPFDLVLMDLHMPVMGGLEAARQIRRHPECARIPIVALTADQRPGVVAECKAAGMDDYVGKPFDPKVLLERIRAILVR